MPRQKKIVSPLRYPGSKRNLVSFIIDLIQINGVRPSLFIEPFVGGGSVALNLLNENLVDRVILVDRDPWITSFWKTVFFDKEWFVDQIQSMDVTIEKWIEYKNSNPISVRDQALTCLFLNRTSFSGILEKRAGPIGGKNQTSTYPIDCRFTQTTRNTLIDRIEQISKFRARIHGILNCSWEEAVNQIRNEQRNHQLPINDLLFYLDPPFFNEAETLYRYYFTDQDHVALRDFLLSLEDKWVLSYDFANQIELLYGDALRKGTNGTKHHQFELLYTIAKISERKKAKEVVITNLERLPSPQIIDVK